MFRKAFSCLNKLLLKLSSGTYFRCIRIWLWIAYVIKTVWTDFSVSTSGVLRLQVWAWLSFFLSFTHSRVAGATKWDLTLKKKGVGERNKIEIRNISLLSSINIGNRICKEGKENKMFCFGFPFICIYVHVSMQVCKQDVGVESDIILGCSPPHYIFRQGLSLEPRAHQFG